VTLELNWRIRDDRYARNAKRNEFLTPEMVAAVIDNRTKEAIIEENMTLLRKAQTWKAPER